MVLFWHPTHSFAMHEFIMFVAFAFAVCDISFGDVYCSKNSSEKMVQGLHHDQT